MAYVPNASDPTQPTEDKTVESAALEFRTIKPVLIRTLRFPAADAPSYRGELPVAANRAGRFLAFDSVTGVPIPGPLLTDWTITQAQITGIGAIADNLTEILQADANAAAAAASALAAATAENAAETAASTATAQAILAQNAASVAGSYLGGFRNRIINGDMRIDQRNDGASITSIGTLSQPVDRWRPFAAAPPAAANVVAQRVNDAPTGFTNSVRFTVGTGTSSGATNGLALGQPIEGFNISDLGWGTATAQPVTLSFWIKSSIAGTYSAAIQNYAETVSYVAAYTVSAANTWEYKTVNIPGPTTGTWPTGNNGAVRVSVCADMGTNLRTSTLNAWQSGVFLAATAQTNWLSTTGATFQITGVQLEAGTVASPFERRDYGRELMMCQRYCLVYSNTTDGNFRFFGFNFSTTTGLAQVYFPVETRVAPTGITTSTASAFTFYQNNTEVAISAIGYDNASTKTANVSVTATGLTQGGGCILAGQDSGNKIEFTGMEL